MILAMSNYIPITKLDWIGEDKRGIGGQGVERDWRGKGGGGNGWTQGREELEGKRGGLEED